MAVESPVAGVVEDEDGVEFEGLGNIDEINRSGEGSDGVVVVVAEDLVEGPDGRVGNEYISRSNDVLEPIPVGLILAHVNG